MAAAITTLRHRIPSHLVQALRAAHAQAAVAPMVEEVVQTAAPSVEVAVHIMAVVPSVEVAAHVPVAAAPSAAVIPAAVTPAAVTLVAAEAAVPSVADTLVAEVTVAASEEEDRKPTPPLPKGGNWRLQPSTILPLGEVRRGSWLKHQNTDFGIHHTRHLIHRFIEMHTLNCFVDDAVSDC